MAEITKQAGPSKGNKPQEGNAIKFDRNVLLRETGAALTVKKGKEKIRSKNVEVSAQVENEYQRFLDTHLKNLHEITQKNPQILQNPSHRLDSLLLTQLSDPDGAPNAAKIRSFIEDPTGIMVVTQVMEQQATLALFALGLQAAIRSPGRRDAAAEDVTIRLGRDQGLINRAWFKWPGPFLNARVAETAGRPDVDTRLGRIFPNVRRWQVAAGTVGLGLIPSGIFATRELVKTGLRIDVRQCVDAFRSIGGLQVGGAAPAGSERDYIFEMTGIDINDFQINAAGNRIEAVAPSNRRSTKSPQAVEEEVLGLLKTRERFYTDIGVDPARLDALSSQVDTWNYTGGQMEQTGVKFQEDIQAEFDRLGGPTGNTARNLQRRMEARMNVTMKAFTEYVGKIDKKENEKKAISTLAEKIKKRSDGTLKTERQNVFLNRKKVLEKDKTLLEPRTQRVKAYHEQVSALEKARRAFAKEFPAAVALGRDEDGEIADIRRRRDSKIPADNSVAYRRDQLLSQQVTDIKAAHGALRPFPAGTNQGTIKSAEDREEARILRLFKPELDQLNAEEAQLTKQEDRIKEIKEAIPGEEKKLEDTEQAVIDGKKETSALAKDFQTLRGWGVTENQLRTLTTDQLIARVNAINAGNPTLGWAENQNTREDSRARVLNAQIEARARQREISLRSPGADFRTFSDAKISEHELLTLTKNQIDNLITARNAAGFPLPLQATFEAAVPIARKRLNARLVALNETDISLGEQVKEQQALADGVDLTRELEDLKLVSDLTGRQGEIYSKINVIYTNIERFTDVTPPDNTFTSEEVTAGFPRGYYELINVLWDYKNKDKYFSNTQRLLPPQTLAEILNERLNLGLILGPGVPAGGIININNVLGQLRNRIENPVPAPVIPGGPPPTRIEPSQLYAVFRDMTNRFVLEANAIPD